jgi:hypothetical protein
MASTFVSVAIWLFASSAARAADETVGRRSWTSTGPRCGWPAGAPAGPGRGGSPADQRRDTGRNPGPYLADTRRP